MTARIAPAASRPRRVRTSARLARWSRPVAAVLAAVALVATGITAAQSATPQLELLVNSLNTTADANPGDGICADAAGECTLRAAIQESNTLNRAADEIRIGMDPAFAGGRIDLTTSTSTWMRTTSVYSGGSIGGDGGAIFEVTAPVIIDLEHKVTAAPVSTLDGPGAAAFYLNGSDIELIGVDNTYSGETAFYVGPNAANVTIRDGAVQTANYYPERFLVVRGGASNVTVRNYDVAGFASNNSEWGWGWVDGATTAATAVTSLTIDNVRYNANLSGSCDSSSATGCSSTPVQAEGQHVNQLTFTNNTVTNFNRAGDNNNRLLNLRNATVGTVLWSGNTITNPRQYSADSLIDFGVSGAGATVGSFTITDNVFTDVQVASEEMNGIIRLPANKSISGTGLISGNTFLAGDAQSQAIYWQGPYSDAVNVSASHVVIEKNYFDGWGDNSSRSTIRMYQTGAVTVRQNTFGTTTGTQTNTVTEEGTASGSYATTMLSNWSYGANGKMNTWFPTARSSANVQSANLTAQRCTIDLEVAPPSDSANNADISGSRYPATPVTLDLYWTASRTAEVYLESVQVASDARTTLQVELPLPGDERLDHLPDGATLPVDPTTGAVSGGLRLQTQDPNAGDTTASSQYSRVALIDGTCQPELTIDQADDQNDPTLARDLHFTVRSSMALDPASLTAEDLALTATATADTIDAARLNPRVVSVTPVAGSDNTEFDVIARVDDSATVTASLGAGTVTSELGLANSQPAASTDNQITFTNPLVVDPPKFTLVTGEPNGKDYTIGLRPGAPEPGAELTFTATVDQTGVTHGVALSTTSPVIAVDAEQTDPITVTAAEGQVTANTRVVIAHEVSSADPNYDGLVVPSVTPHLFATDPTVQITKRAYTEVTDSSSPAQIEATGTEALSGTRLVDGQAVCWVYTVTNVSADDWATSLTGITVTDSDTRLGTGGVIGTIGTLGIGEQQKLSACAVLIPTDTTAVTP
ncbi:hypothetical protein [Cellulomonas denverensis]|uniref:Uncharacterized protein n=1 Tax=Cellulomonas denverensis TaxID=264297 RepID=A0A7X6KYA0_9CELL|nr:hypothetical protein [Cellulomonas denverensis]NKY24423.1 hypothetical protein [Cellulomonas denverensis]